MHSSRKRWIKYYWLDLRPSTELAGPWNVPLKVTLEELAKRHAQDGAEKHAESPNRILQIADVQYRPQSNTYVLLFTLADMDVNASFLNIETGLLRKARKGDDEGFAVQAHMVISLQPTRLGYPVSMEHCTGITRAATQILLQSEFEHLCEEYVSDSGSEDVAYPIPKLDIVVSEEWDGMSANWTLKRLEVVEPVEKSVEFDGIPLVVPKRRNLVLSTTAKVEGQMARQLIAKIHKRTRESDRRYSEIKITVQDDGRQQTINLPVDVEEVTAHKIAKWDRLIVKPPPKQEQGRPSIYEDLAQRMTEKLLEFQDNNRECDV